MRTLVGTFGVIAALALLATFMLFSWSLVPAPFRAFDGANSFGYAFFVFFMALVSLALWAAAAPLTRDVLRSKHKFLFVASAAIVITYCILIVVLIYEFNHSEL